MMRAFQGMLIIFMVLFLFGCSQKPLEVQNKDTQFINEEYGVSFSYPSDWKESKEGMPDKWAIVNDKKDTIIFVAGPAKSQDLLVLGRSLALKDLYGENIDPAAIKKEDLLSIAQIVRLDSLNNRTWYNYGIKFQDKGVDSFISGTICNESEITMVLVSNSFDEVKNQETYKKMLETFKC
jgi:hypothetical protein